MSPMSPATRRSDTYKGVRAPCRWPPPDSVVSSNTTPLSAAQTMSGTLWWAGGTQFIPARHRRHPRRHTDTAGRVGIRCEPAGFPRSQADKRNGAVAHTRMLLLIRGVRAPEAFSSSRFRVLEDCFGLRLRVVAVSFLRKPAIRPADHLLRIDGSIKFVGTMSTLIGIHSLPIPGCRLLNRRVRQERGRVRKQLRKPYSLE